MEQIFILFCNLFFAMFEVIDTLFTPIMNLVGEYAPNIVEFVTWILSFVIDILATLIEGIIDFLSFDWLNDLFDW